WWAVRVDDRVAHHHGEAFHADLRLPAIGATAGQRHDQTDSDRFRPRQGSSQTMGSPARPPRPTTRRPEMFVRDVMQGLVRTCRTEDSLAEAAQLLWEHDCECAPVVDATGRLAGMITDRDVCKAVYASGHH